jgi:hypothetical protein
MLSLCGSIFSALVGVAAKQAPPGQQLLVHDYSLRVLLLFVAHAYQSKLLPRPQQDYSLRSCS